MDEEEMKGWDNALLNLVNMGLIKIVKNNGKVSGFILNKDLSYFQEEEDD